MRLSYVFVTVAAACIITPGCSTICKTSTSMSFGYTGRTAPEFWSCLKLENTLCGIGRKQSPIDIMTTSVLVDASLPQIQTDYHETNAVLINNGHTLEVEYHNDSRAFLGSEEYELLQFHFHSHSEHRVDGIPADMEGHLVHRKANGELLVIGLLMNIGAENSFLTQFWYQFPVDKKEVHTRMRINVFDLLPADLSYYTYQGSLTTPPCNEIVTWVVLKTPVEMSRAQLDFFISIIGNNARPVQDIYDRIVRSAG